MAKGTATRGDIRQRRWTEGRAREVLAELTASGERPAAFARRKGIAQQRLSYWSNRIAATSPSAAFVAVALPVQPSTAWIELEIRGAIIRIREGLDVEHVARLIAAIARRVDGPC